MNGNIWFNLDFIIANKLELNCQYKGFFTIRQNIVSCAISLKTQKIDNY